MARDPKVVADFRLPFGKHKGRALCDIVAADGPEGARYLDWLVGQDWLFPEVRQTLETFLKIDWVARAVDAALEERGDD